MAKKIDTEMLPDKAANMSSDRARRINSLHRSVDDIVKQQNKKRLQVSTEISSLTKEQQRLMQQLDVERGKFTNDTASAYDSVVDNLGKTIRNLSIGVKNITTDTAKATSDVISQYGAAVTEDININKQNTMAMALSRATPLFGYFAAKFMETDVFKDAAQKMKDRVTSSLVSAGQSLKNVFTGNKVEDDEGVPKMAKGGYVRKGGMVEVHAAEIVSPIEKILQLVEESNNNEQVVEQLVKINKTISKTSTSSKKEQRELLKSLNELKVGLIGTVSQMQIHWQRFLLEHPSLKAMLTFAQTMKSVISSPFSLLFAARGGFAGDVRRATRSNNIFEQQVGLLTIIYSKGMTFLRNIDKYTKVTAEALVGQEVSPVTSKKYTLFGKIKSFMTNKPTEKKSIFDQFVDNLELDKGALAEAGIRSFNDLLSPGIILKNMGITKKSIKEKFFGGVGRKEIKESATGAYKNMSEAAWNAKFDAEFKARAAKKRAERYAEKGKTKVQESWHSMAENLRKLRELKQDQEDREGPHSPSMADNIRATAETMKKDYEDSFERAKKQARSQRKKHLDALRERKRKKREAQKLSETLNGIKDENKEQNRFLGALKYRFKKFSRNVASSFPLLYNIISKVVSGITSIGKWSKKLAIGLGKKLQQWFPMFYTMFSRIFSGIFSVAKRLGSLLRIFGSFMGRKTLGTVGKMGKNILKGGTKIAAGARGAFAGGGVEGVLGWAGRGVMSMGAAGATAAGGAVVGGGMALWDMIQAMREGDATGWAKNFAVRGIAGFLGGTDTGVKGMAKGALKGASLGAAIGTIVPGFGTAIGAGVGGLIGGFLGFVGGKELSKAIEASMKGVRELIGGMWKVVKFPFQVIKEGYKMIWVLIKHAWKKIYSWLDEKLSGEGIIGDTWKGIKILVRRFADAFNAIGNKIKAIADSVKEFFSGPEGDWTTALKKGIHNLLYFIPNLVTAIKYIGEMIDEWLMKAPYGIGRAYRWAKKFAKGAAAGTLAESLEKSLEGGKIKEIGSTAGATSATIAKLEGEAKAKEYEQQEKIAKEVAKENAKNMANQTNALNNQSKTSANMIISSNQNTNVNNVAPGEGRGWRQVNNSNVNSLLFASHQ